MIRFKKHIRKESRQEVNKFIDEYSIKDIGGLHLLGIFADADTIERDAQDILNVEGLTFKNRFGETKSHPLLIVIRDARSQKMTALKALSLDLEPLKSVGRPPGR